jgi:ParB/RepB/Spo0J family partition protein
MGYKENERGKGEGKRRKQCEQGGKVMSQVAELPLDRLYVGEINVRRDVGDISELTMSIKAKGVLEPIIVRSVGNKYEIVVGRRRFEAAKAAGLKTIPSIIRNISNGEAVATSLMENIQRGNLTDEEEIESMLRLMELDPENYGSERRLSQSLGLSLPAISRKFTAYELVQKLRTKGKTVFLKGTPTLEERAKGEAIPIEHAEMIERALRSEEVSKLPKEEVEQKTVELAETITPLPQVDARKVVDRFKMYPEKSIEEIKNEALARQTGIALETFLPPRVARDLDRLAEERKTSIEEILPDVVERGLKVQTEERERVEVPAKMIDEVEVGEIECPKCRAQLRLIHCEPGKAHKIERKAV